MLCRRSFRAKAEGPSEIREAVNRLAYSGGFAANGLANIATCFADRGSFLAAQSKQILAAGLEKYLVRGCTPNN